MLFRIRVKKKYGASIVRVCVCARLYLFCHIGKPSTEHLICFPFILNASILNDCKVIYHFLRVSDNWCRHITPSSPASLSCATKTRRKITYNDQSTSHSRLSSPMSLFQSLLMPIHTHYIHGHHCRFFVSRISIKCMR